ncbi:MAG TPA: hypothetical protein VG319_09805 [Polyangia bacterium]|nr:hypothetical protein [Polyangia bacterium]
MGVPKFDGPQEAVIRKAVMHALKGGGYEVVGSREIDAAAKSAGAELDANDGFKAVAKELAISAFVTGEVGKKKAKLTVRTGSDGSVTGEGSFAGANPRKIAAEVRDGFGRRLGSAVDRGHAPAGAKKPQAPAPEPEVAEDDKDEGGATEGGDEGDKGDKDKSTKAESKGKKGKEAESEEAPPASSSGGPEETVAKKAPSEPEGEAAAVGPRALDIGIGFGGFSRSLSYNQDVYGTLRQYKLALGPAAVVSLLLFPGAFAVGGVAANIGLEANIEQAFGVTSTVPTSTTFPMGATFGTIVHDYYVGGRFRFVLAGGHELAVTAGGGEHAFSFRDGPAATDIRANLNIPDTIYRYVRGGVVGRFELPSGVTLGLGGAYRYILNKAGQISTGPVINNGMVQVQGFFPYLAVAGIDVDATLGYHVTPSIEARVGVNLRRYFYAMNSSPAKCAQGCDFLPDGTQVNQVAGGAIDQYIGFNIGAAYIFGGVVPGASSRSEEPAAEEAPPPKKHKKKKKHSEDEDEDEGDKGGGDKKGSSEE